MAGVKGEGWQDDMEAEKESLELQMKALEERIEAACERDDFEQAEVLDNELRALNSRLELVNAMLGGEAAPESYEEEYEDDYEEEEEYEEEEQAAEEGSGLPRKKSGRASRRSARQRSSRGSGKEVEKKAESGKEGGEEEGAEIDWENGVIEADVVVTAAPPSGAVLAVLDDVQMLRRILYFLDPNSLARVSGVNKRWHEAVCDDSLWQHLFRKEWVYELVPAPGTYKRWYGAIQSATLSWENPILSQKRVEHPSLCGRLEVKQGDKGRAFLVAMVPKAQRVSVFDYHTLQHIHDISSSCSFALDPRDHCKHLVGGDKAKNKWSVWDIASGDLLFEAPAEPGSFEGGWYVVRKDYLIVFRRNVSLLVAYSWNYSSKPHRIRKPQRLWQAEGRYALPKATKYGLLLLDFQAGLVRFSYESGQKRVLLEENVHDLDPRDIRIKFHVQQRKNVIVRQTVFADAPIRVYRQTSRGGVSLQHTVLLPDNVTFVSYGDEEQMFMGLMKNALGVVQSVAFLSSTQAEVAQASLVPVELPDPSYMVRDVQWSNGICVALFASEKGPTILYLFECRAARVLRRMESDEGQKPVSILRFTGITMTLVDRAGAVSKMRVSGRRTKQPESGCSVQ